MANVWGFAGELGQGAEAQPILMHPEPCALTMGPGICPQEDVLFLMSTKAPYETSSSPGFDFLVILIAKVLQAGDGAVGRRTCGVSGVRQEVPDSKQWPQLFPASRVLL